MARLLPIVFAAMAALLSGCATFGTLQRAETLGAGGVQLALEPSIWSGSVSGERLTLPDTDLAVRVGVAERVDLQARIGSSLLELGGKVQLTPKEQERVVVSIAPTASAFVIGSGEANVGFGTVHVPVIVGVGVGEHQLVLAPKLHDIFAFGGGAGAHVVSAGASVGFAFRVGKRFSILPEYARLQPVWVTGASGGETTTEFVGEAGVAFSQISLAFLFDLGK